MGEGIALEPVDFERDRWGRPLVLVDGKKVPYQRPSSLGDCIDNRWNLELWKNRRALQGLATDHALYATAVALEITDTKENKQEWNDLVESCLAAVRSSARAELGTALHKMTERADRGEVLDLPPVFAADVKAYRDALTLAGLEVVPGMIECRCVCDDLKAAGTFDRLVQDADGNVFIADLKTGDGVYPHGFAVQLAVYAHSWLYDPATGERTPLPGKLIQNRGVIIHLPAGTGQCSIHEIDLIKGWSAAITANWVRNDWQKDKGLLSQLSSVSAPVEKEPAPEKRRLVNNEFSATVQEVAGRRLGLIAPDDPETSAVRERIDALTDWQRQHLKAVWPKGVSVKRGLTPHQVDEVNLLIDKVLDTAIERVTSPPDEGRDIERSTVEALKAQAAALSPDKQEWVRRITSERNRVEGGSHDPNAPMSLRRFEIGRALVLLAKYGQEDRLPESIAAVIGDVPGTPGALLASMGVEEATKFAHLVDVIVSHGDEGDETPRLMPVA